jgi:hypothetical protein
MAGNVDARLSRICANTVGAGFRNDRRHPFYHLRITTFDARRLRKRPVGQNTGPVRQCRDDVQEPFPVMTNCQILLRVAPKVILTTVPVLTVAVYLERYLFQRPNSRNDCRREKDQR